MTWIKNGKWIEKGAEIVKVSANGAELPGHIGQVVEATYGHNTTRNEFRLIIGETAKTVVLMALPHQQVTGRDTASGTEKALIEFSEELSGDHDFIIRARKVSVELGELQFRAAGRWFSFWDGKPKLFDLLD